jgi:hypothetical protein
MSSRSRRAVAIASVIELAEEHGHLLDPDHASELFGRLGFDGACEQVVLAERLRGVAALELRERLPIRDAYRLLAATRRDFDAACVRLRAEAEARRRRRVRVEADTLLDLAAEQGTPVSRRTARRLASRHAHDAPEYLRGLGRVRDAASRSGMRIDAASAALRITAAEGDAQLAIERLDQRARNRRLMEAKYCRAPYRSGSRDVRIDRAARCKCRGCFYKLWEELEPYTNTLIERHRRRHCRDRDRFEVLDDLRGTARQMLYEACLGWSCNDGFATFYGTVLTNALNSALRVELAEIRGGGARPASLEAPLFYDGLRPVTLADRVPDRSIDPLTILLAKERLEEMDRSRRYEIEEIEQLYAVLAAHE